MVQVVSEVEGSKNRRSQPHEGVVYHRIDYLVPPVAIATTLGEMPLHKRGAQAFIVEQPPRSVVRPHFHVSNQFQVILKGDGLLGKHPVAPISVHYAGGYTGYGPITAGEDGLSYFTLRAQFDSGPHHLPEARSELKDVVRQFLLVDDIRVSSPAELAERSGFVMETIIERQKSGLAGYVARIGPAVTCQPPISGGGQFWVVIGGAAIFEGKDLPPFSCLFVEPTDGLVSLAAGDLGVEVLVLQYPTEVEAAARPRLAAQE